MSNSNGVRVLDVKKYLRWYLGKFNSRPLASTFFGFLVFILGSVIVVTILQIATYFLDLDILVFMVLVFPVWIFLTVWIFFVGMLFVEVMWKFFGVYWLLGIGGRPIRVGFASWLGETDES